MIRDLLADEGCGQAMLDFLSTPYVERLVPPLEESDAAGEASEWELRERREREEEREAEGAVLPPFLPILSFMPSAGEEYDTGCASFPFFPWVFPLLISWGAYLAILGTGQGGGQKGELATCRHCADFEEDKWAKCTPP